MRQMDEMTQHNAALVEQTNAAIEQTEAQAAELDRIVDVFTLAETDRGTAAVRPAVPKPQGVKALQDKLRTAARNAISARATSPSTRKSSFDSGARGSRS